MSPEPEGAHRPGLVRLRRWTKGMRRFWPEAAAGLAPAAVFWRLLFGGQVLYWGLPVLQFVPWRALAADAIRDGRLPLWTPLLGMGAPLMANHQSAVFYPPNLLALLVPPEVAVSALAVLHLSLAGVGMVRFARRLGLGPFGAALAGVSFGLSGYLTGRLWFVSINNAMAWLPWIMVAATPAPDDAPTPDRRGIVRPVLALSGLVAIQLLAGHAQSSFYTLLLAAAWIVWQSLSRSGRWRALALSALQFALAVVLAFGLASVQLVPTIELLRQSPRADAADYGFAMTYSLWPWRLFTLAAPGFFGHPADHDYWGYGAYWEDNAYLGVLPLLFGLYAASGPLRRGGSRPTVLSFSLVVAAASIVLALGDNTPLFPLFYRYVPGFGLFQAPARMMIWYTFAMSVMAGLGADAWRPSERKRYWARLGLAGSLGLLGLSILGALAAADPRAGTFGWGTAWAAAFSAGAFLLLLLQPPSPGRWPAVIFAFVVFDLGLAAVRLNPTTDRSLYLLKPDTALAEGRLYHFADDEYRVKFHEFFRFNSFDPLDAAALRRSLLPNLAALDGTASANNFDPLLPARYVAYLRAMESAPQLLALADVRAVVRPGGAIAAAAPSAARVRVVYESQTVPDGAAALKAITAPTFDPASTVILEPEAGGALSGLALDPNRLSLSLHLERDGYVVVSDTYYPGWRVTVDGVSQALRRADYNFRAVAVSAGQHEVIFEYAPLSVTLGLAISGLAAIAWGLAWLARRAPY